MKKYIKFATFRFKESINSITDNIGTFISFTVHILVFNELWDFVLEGKTIAGFSKEQLIWYVILAEVITYSFHYYYKVISYKIESGFIAYDMSKPYNFILRIIAEGIASLPNTFVLFFLGIILGVICGGPITYSVLSWVSIIIIVILSCVLQLMIHIAVGLTTIWLGREISSVWLLVSKAMLIFVFTPVDLLPEAIQFPIKLIPTTCVVYTPSKLLAHYSHQLFLSSIAYELFALLVLTVILVFIYLKGVKKLNVEGS